MESLTEISFEVFEASNTPFRRELVAEFTVPRTSMRWPFPRFRAEAFLIMVHEESVVMVDTRDISLAVVNAMTFSFSGATVTIPLSELVFEGYTETGFPDNACIFGLTYSEPGVNLMGDPFLRGAYVVYDLANNEISLANANYDGGKDDILEIGTGTAAVPGATLMPSAVTSATGNGAAATGIQTQKTLSPRFLNSGCDNRTASITNSRRRSSHKKSSQAITANNHQS